MKMRNSGILFLIGISISLWIIGSRSMAEDTATSSEPEAQPAAPAMLDSTADPAGTVAPQSTSAQDTGQNSGISKRKTRGKRASDRDAEGSEAPNRFEANTVIKSKYLLNGEPLEVDPD